jgi:hypothetical protein
VALRQRLDKWLWFARVARTRSLAARLVAEGHVRLNARRIETPARGVGPGDVLDDRAGAAGAGPKGRGFRRAPRRFFRSFSLVRGILGPGDLYFARPCEWSYLKLEHSRTAARKHLGFLQKSCKIPWTIWTYSAKGNHPHGLDRVPQSGRRQGAARANARFWKVLESL